MTKLLAVAALPAIAIVGVALNLRPVMAGVGPLLDQIGAATGLTNTQASLLTTIPVAVIGLCALLGRRLRALGMQRSALSHLLRTLAERGWIERRRRGEDQRSVHLFVTPAGRGIVGATDGRMVGVLRHAVEQLDDTQLEHLEHSLQALLQHIEAPAPGMGRPARTRATRK